MMLSILSTACVTTHAMRSRRTGDPRRVALLSKVKHVDRGHGEGFDGQADNPSCFISGTFEHGVDEHTHPNFDDEYLYTKGFDEELGDYKYAEAWSLRASNGTNLFPIQVITEIEGSDVLFELVLKDGSQLLSVEARLCKWEEDRGDVKKTKAGLWLTTDISGVTKGIRSAYDSLWEMASIYHGNIRELNGKFAEYRVLLQEDAEDYGVQVQDSAGEWSKFTGVVSMKKFAELFKLDNYQELMIDGANYRLEGDTFYTIKLKNRDERSVKAIDLWLTKHKLGVNEAKVDALCAGYGYTRRQPTVELGYAHKKSGGFTKKFQRRRFVLKNKRVYYYKDGVENPKGDFDLRTITLDATYSNYILKFPVMGANTEKRTWELRFNSRVDARDFCEKLQRIKAGSKFKKVYQRLNKFGRRRLHGFHHDLQALVA